MASTQAGNRTSDQRPVERRTLHKLAVFKAEGNPCRHYQQRTTNTHLFGNCCKPIVPCENQARTVGVDLGVGRLAMLSDGTFIEGQSHRARH